MKPSTNRLPLLDVLRMLAAVWVFAAHSLYSVNTYITGDVHGLPLVPQSNLFLEIARFGYLGPDVFFVISGLVITRTAIGRSAGQFVVARFSRLLPSFLIAALLSLVVATTLSTPSTDQATTGGPLTQFLPSLTLLNYPLGIQWYVEGSYWTLWTESSFYILVALALLLGRVGTRKHMVIFLTLWLTATIFLTPSNNVIPALNAALNVTFAPYFILGAAVGLARNRRDLLLLSPIIAAAATLTVNTLIVRGAFATPTGAASIAVAGLLLLVGVLIRPRNARFAKICQTIGLASYPMYLINLRFGGWLVGMLEARGLEDIVAVGLVALFLVAVTVTWSATVEPRLQTLLKRAMDGARQRFSEPLPAAAGGGSAPSRRALHAERKTDDLR